MISICKAEILFLAADPFSTSSGGHTSKLQLGQDARGVKERVSASPRGKSLEFDWRFAVTPDDLLSALLRTRPRVIHWQRSFSLTSEEKERA